MHEFLVKIQDEYNQIASNQISRFESGLSLEQFNSACDKLLENLKLLRASTDEILKNHLDPMLTDIDKISDDDETELFNAAQNLSSYEKRQDPGLALKIYKALLNKARKKRNEANILKYLYWCGITQFFLYGQNSDLSLVYFQEGAGYEDKYDSLEDPEIRKYVHRCLGNASMSLYAVNKPEKAHEREEATFNFWNKLLFKGKDPDFPWLNYFLNIYNQRLNHVSKGINTDPDSETKENIEKVLNISLILNKMYHKNHEYHKTFGGTRYDFHLWEAQFLAGLISFDHLLENIEKKRAEVAPDDFSADSMYIRIQINSYLMFYASKMKSLKARRDEIVKKASNDSVEYLLSLPKTVSTEQIKVYIKSFSKSLSAMFTPEEQLDFILKMTTFRHIPTHAHSIMVSKVAVLLTEFLVDNEPSYFIGLPGINDEDDVKDNREELIKTAEISGLCHDVGKIGSIENPYMHIRTLTAEEFEIIMEHPEEGAIMMGRDDGDTTNEYYVDVILGHHKYYDNSGGYPAGFDITQSKYRAMINIISVSNSLVSATDKISKTYTDIKTLREVRTEIKEGSGTRYSPVLAKLIYDENVYASLYNLLVKERPDAYYAAYLYAWSGGKQS